MTLLADGQTTVGKLRARGGGLDPLLARLRLQNVLGAVELRPPALPPSAILCVRAMGDPLGGVLTVAGGARPPAAWQQAATAELDRLTRQAARPAQASVPARAEAVLFADRAELLAQLAQDWCAGVLTARWWWRALFPGDTASAVVPAWLAAPTQIPAALAHLIRAGAATGFVAMLDVHAVDSLLHALTRSYELSAVGDVRDRWLRSPAAPSAASGRGAAPWVRLVPETEGAGLTPDRELFLGIGLLLWRAPAAVRLESFGDALALWSGLTPSSGWPADDEPGRPPIETELPVDADWMRPARTRPHDGGAAEAVGACRADDGSPASDRAPPDALADPAAVGIDDGDSRIGLSASEFVRSEIESSSPPGEARDEPVGIDEATIDTAFGGLFFLINLGIGLGLYGDFTMPAEPGISLSPWDFLALLGRRLAGAEIEADPVWPLLAGLAGRFPEEEPGAGFSSPSDWRLPPDWLDPFAGRGHCSWAADRRHLVVEHPAGFTILDLGLSHLPSASRSRSRQLRRLLQRELVAYPNTIRPRPDPVLLGAIADSPLARWLDWLVPYVEARLAVALRIERTAVADLLVRLPARVFVSAVNVDVIFSLAQLPIAIRLVGLDRDPGWLPAANRVVTFRFE